MKTEIDANVIDFFYNEFKKYRFPITQIKEKYGTVRVYTGLGWSCLLHLTHPGYVHYRPYSDWLATFDIYHGYKVLRYTGLQFLSYRFHCFMYRRIYSKAIKKWPELRDNIIPYADYYELLKGL